MDGQSGRTHIDMEVELACLCFLVQRVLGNLSFFQQKARTPEVLIILFGKGTIE